MFDNLSTSFIFARSVSFLFVCLFFNLLGISICIDLLLILQQLTHFLKNISVSSKSRSL